MYVAVIRTPNHELLVGAAPSHADRPIVAIQKALASLFDESLHAEVFHVPAGHGWCINSERRISGENVAFEATYKVKLAESQSDSGGQVVHFSVELTC